MINKYKKVNQIINLWYVYSIPDFWISRKEWILYRKYDKSTLFFHLHRYAIIYVSLIVTENTNLLLVFSWKAAFSYPFFTKYKIRTKSRQLRFFFNLFKSIIKRWYWVVTNWNMSKKSEWTLNLYKESEKRGKEEIKYEKINDLQGLIFCTAL